jgi:hypothetical protein
MSEFNVTIENFNDLSPAEQDLMPNNGVGKQYASYIRVRCYGETIMLKSDAIEPEDKTFFRELSWIKGALERAYETGVEDASQEYWN